MLFVGERSLAIGNGENSRLGSVYPDNEEAKLINNYSEELNSPNLVLKI